MLEYTVGWGSIRIYQPIKHESQEHRETYKDAFQSYI